MAQGKVAVVGVGHWGANLLRNFHALLGSEQVVACDAVESRLSEAKSDFPGIQTTSSFSDVLDNKLINSVVIATPVITHFKLAESALQAGKHVFVEKPITLNSTEAQKLITLADSRKMTLMVDHLLLYHPAIIKLKELIDSGELGDVFYIYNRRTNFGIVRTEENALWSLGPHDITVLLFLFGAEPVEVNAQGASYLQPGIEDVVFVNLGFPDGKMGNLHLSWLDPIKTRHLVVVGSKKMATLNEMAESPLMLVDKHVALSNGKPELKDGAATPVDLGAAKTKEPLRAVCEHFLDCVATGKRPKSDGQDGLRVLKVLEEAQRSMKSQANASLSR